MLPRAAILALLSLALAGGAFAQPPDSHGQPANQLSTRVGNVLSISAVVPGQAAPNQPATSCMIITYPDAPFSGPPNVLLTVSSVHFVASPLWVESRRFGLCVDRKTPATAAQSLNIYMLIQGPVPDSASTAGPLHLTSTPVKNMEELLRLRGQ